MSNYSIPRQRVVVVAMLLVVFSGATHAADPLAWKFTPGATNRYRMIQTMDMHMQVGGNDVGSKVKQTIDMSWKVQEVKADGSALLDQKIDRMRMTISSGGTEVDVDSASQEAPQNQAAMLAPLLKGLTSKSFTVTMTPRGEIVDVEVPEEMVNALKNAPGAALMGDLATEEGFKMLVSQASFVLPEKLEPGGEWTRKVEMKIPAIGKQVAATTYRYEGARELDGQEFEVFKPTLQISYEGDQSTISIADQKSSGEILFNREAGRLEQSKLKQSMNLKIAGGGQQIDQKLDQVVEMTWIPEDAE